MEKSDNTAVLERTEEAAVQQPTAPATETISSMAEKMADVAPEKRRLFRKACNHVARSVLFELLILNVVAVIVVAVYFVFNIPTEALNALMAGDSEGYINALNSVMNDTSFWTFMMAGNAVGALAGNLLAALLHSRKRGYKLFEGFREGRLNAKLFLGGLVTAFGAMWAWSLIYDIVSSLLKFDNPAVESSNAQADALLSVKNIPGLVIYALYVCIIAPITEEILFRGVLLKTLSKYNVSFAAVVSALLFGLVHGNLMQTPGAFLAGLALAYVAIRSGSLRGSILIHMFINTFSTAVGFLDMNMKNNETVFTVFGYQFTIYDIAAYAFAIAMIIAAIIIISVCGKKLRWSAIDPATNHVLLPKVNTRVKYRYAHFITCFWVLVFLYVSVETILVNSGFTPLIGKLLEKITSELS